VRGLFVTGTDTGVGKTQVACALLRLWREAGLRPAPLKPAETGCQPDPEDALALMREAEPELSPPSPCPSPASGRGDSLDVVCPYRFREPLAPAVAARLEGRVVEIGRVLVCAEQLSVGDRPLLVESAGGLLVPLTERETNADLAVRLGLPLLVVARAGLGTINHTVLTIEAARARGLRVAAVVLNRASSATADPSEATNPAEIVRLTGVPVLGPLPFVESATERIARLAELLSRAPELGLNRLTGLDPGSTKPALSRVDIR
jgi:dethiobiotin synthetase